MVDNSQCSNHVARRSHVRYVWQQRQQRRQQTCLGQWNIRWTFADRRQPRRRQQRCTRSHADQPTVGCFWVNILKSLTKMTACYDQVVSNVESLQNLHEGRDIRLLVRDFHYCILYIKSSFRL
jgi:hypothetical protein